jgi:hypothetical protein
MFGTLNGQSCGIGLDKTDVCQEPPMLGTVMSKRGSEADLCTEKRIGCTIKLHRVLEVPRKGLIYVPWLMTPWYRFDTTLDELY